MIEFPKKNFIDRRARLDRMIPLFAEDLKTDLPWFYHLGDISKRFKLDLPGPHDVITSLQQNGFTASLTHFDGTAIKTDFPLEIEAEKLFK